VACASILTRSSLAGAASYSTRTAIPFDDPVTVGRTGKVPIGVDIPDEGISRVALTITATTEGWEIANTSRNGLIVNPWGLIPQRSTTTMQLRWPLVAIRTLGTRPGARHEVLLECEAYNDSTSTPTTNRGPTAGAKTPRPLTPAESEALATVFEPILAWPPTEAAAEPLQLKQVARRLGITPSAVKARLEGVRAKAQMLGLARQVGVTDPAYLHVLVAAGYLDFPRARSEPQLGRLTYTCSRPAAMVGAPIGHRRR
jgi:hypothetical protein